MQYTSVTSRKMIKMYESNINRKFIENEMRQNKMECVKIDTKYKEYTIRLNFFIQNQTRDKMTTSLNFWAIFFFPLVEYIILNWSSVLHWFVLTASIEIVLQIIGFKWPPSLSFNEPFFFCCRFSIRTKEIITYPEHTTRDITFGPKKNYIRINVLVVLSIVHARVS